MATPSLFIVSHCTGNLKACGRAVHYSLFITRGYEQDTKNERSSSATEMIVEGSTVDFLDSE